MKYRWLALIPVFYVVLVQQSYTQVIDGDASFKGVRIVPECEFVLLDLVEARFNWGLMDACWTGDRLYIPLDSLSSKLGLPRIPSLAQLDTAAEPFIQLLGTQDSIPTIYFFDQTSDNRLFADGGLLSLVLGVEFEFSYREMRLRVFSVEPFPRRARIERLSSLAQRVKPTNEYPNAYTIGRQRLILHPGILLWNVSGTNTYDAKTDIRSNGYFGSLNYRTELLRGAFSVQQQFRDNRSLFDERPEMTLQWDFPSQKWVESIKVGKMNASLSQIQSADGILVTNRPTYPRLTAGNWSFDGTLPLGWDLEVTQGNDLVAFEMATRGETPFNFSLPLNFGQNNYTARWYNSTGLQREQSILLYIPSRALPKGEFEYTFSGGRLRTGSLGNFGNAEIGYGLLSNLTITNDVYVVDTKSNDFYYNMRSGFTFTDSKGNAIEAKYGIKGGYEIGYQRLNLGSGNVGFNYIRSKPEELERGFVLSSVLRNVSGYGDQRFRIGKMFGSISVRGNWTDFGRNENLSTSIRAQLSRARLQTTLSYSKAFTRLDNSRFRPAFDQLSLGAFRSVNRYWSMAGSISAQPTIARFQSISIGAQRGFRSFYFSSDVRYDYQFKSFGMFVTGRFQLDQVGINTQVQSRNKVTFSNVTMYGNVAYDPGYNKVFFDYLNLPERSGVAISAYIDSNGNRKHDKGEQLIPNLDVNMVRGGRKIQGNFGSTVTRMADLFPYQEYFVKIGASNEYPDYKPINPVIKFIAEPNRWKTIMVPMQPTVEVILYVTSANTLAPNTSSLKLRLEPIDADGDPYVATGFNDGTIYFSQVIPGRYHLVWDDQQLRIRGLGLPVQEVLEITTDDAPALERPIVMEVRR
jgi:hypothetical protein